MGPRRGFDVDLEARRSNRRCRTRTQDIGLRGVNGGFKEWVEIVARFPIDWNCKDGLRLMMM